MTNGRRCRTDLEEDAATQPLQRLERAGKLLRARRTAAPVIRVEMAIHLSSGRGRHEGKLRMAGLNSPRGILETIGGRVDRTARRDQLRQTSTLDGQRQRLFE